MAKHLKILIPHDLDNDYINLIPLINRFEENSKFSEICLYHAYEPPNLRGKNLPETLKSLIKDDEVNISNILNTQKKIFQRLLNSTTEIRTIFKRNKPIPGIKTYAKKYKPDVIMMTTKQYMGVSKFINSSYALKLFNVLDVPILIMPRDYAVTRELRLNFLIQHHDNYDLAKEMSKDFRQIFDNVRFIHRDPTLSVKSTKRIKVVGSITEYIRESKYDEVFMLIRKKKNPLQKVMSKGFVDRLVGINQAPVIIVNE